MSKENFEEALEAAYWDMDAMIKGYGEWKQTPKSERDAFKAVVRKLVREQAGALQFARMAHSAPTGEVNPILKGVK